MLALTFFPSLSTLTLLPSARVSSCSSAQSPAVGGFEHECSSQQRWADVKTRWDTGRAPLPGGVQMVGDGVQPGAVGWRRHKRAPHDCPPRPTAVCLTHSQTPSAPFML